MPENGRAWVLDVLAIMVGVVLAEIVIQLAVTPTIAKRTNSGGMSNGPLPAVANGTGW